MELISKTTGLRIEEIVDDSLKVEFIRFKLGHERQVGKNWEEIEVHETVRITAKDSESLEAYANGRARKLANVNDCEVRWNYLWSNQGHYIQP